MYEKIPGELKKYNNWICWQAFPAPKKDDPYHIGKRPVNAVTGAFASSTDPSTWCNFETAVRCSAQYSGIGFVFTDSPFFGVDIDGVGDDVASFLGGDAGNIVGEFIHTLQSYSEVSQSGKGIHIICRGSLPEGGRRKGNVEMYETGRFFTMSGNTAYDYDITDCTDSIKPLHEKYIGGGSAPKPKAAHASPPAIAPVSESVSELLEKCRRSKQGALLDALMAGDFSGNYSSQSEADMALCNILAFWLQRDAEAMDSVFRTSGLMRDKWDRKQSGSTYGALTIQKAVSECVTCYGEKAPSEEYSITVRSDGEHDVRNKDGEKIRLYPMDDTGNAERLFVNYGDRLKYNYVEKSWYFWDLRKWCKDISGTAERITDDSFSIMETEAEIYRQIDEKTGSQGEDGKAGDSEKAFRKHIKASRSSKAKKAMRTELQHLVPIVPGQFDRDKYLLNTPDCIIDLWNRVQVPHDLNRYITKITGTSVSESDCPQWKAFLETIFAGDAELMRYIQKAVGYSLCGAIPEQCAFFLYGTGRNGKSTFLDTVRAMMGDYACNAQPDTIMVTHNNSGGARSDIARLKGARMVTTVEPNEGMRLDEGLIKQLTGGDPVTARFQYSSEFEFTPEFKIWMATNHKPIIRGTDTGIWRRIHLIPFTVQIPEDKVDRNLPYKLRKELPAILRWAVEGYYLYKDEGLKKPAAVLAAVSEYRREMDVISSFLSDCCIMGSGEVSSNVLFSAYSRWADENGEYHMSHTKFSGELQKRDGISKVRKSDGMYIVGLTLNNEFNFTVHN